MTRDDRLAVLSDIHGNRLALEAVLEDCERRGIQRMVNLGDSLYGPLDPAGTAELLLAHQMTTVRGNEDRTIIEDPADGDSPTLRFVRSALAAEHLRWLATLPLQRVVDETVCMIHASPHADDAYLLWSVEPGGARRRRPDELREELGDISAPLLLCGHDHVPATLRLPGGVVIVDPGSVGLQAYTDEQPFPHAMQCGSPHARYAVVSNSRSGWHVEHVAVPYDWESAARTAAANGRPDWASWLRTGWAA